VWRRQAALQRRTAGVLVALEHEGYLVLHDITLPGWPASLHHLVVGATGAWVVKSWQPGWLALLPKSTSRWRARGGSTGMLRGLRGEAAAVADALASNTAMSVRPLPCTHGGLRPAGRRLVHGIPVAGPRQLADIVRQGSRVQRGEVEQATARAWKSSARRCSSCSSLGRDRILPRPADSVVERVARLARPRG